MSETNETKTAAVTKGVNMKALTSMMTAAQNAAFSMAVAQKDADKARDAMAELKQRIETDMAAAREAIAAANGALAEAKDAYSKSLTELSAHGVDLNSVKPIILNFAAECLKLTAGAETAAKPPGKKRGRKPGSGNKAVAGAEANTADAAAAAAVADADSAAPEQPADGQAPNADTGQSGGQETEPQPGDAVENAAPPADATPNKLYFDPTKPNGGLPKDGVINSAVAA